MNQSINKLHVLPALSALLILTGCLGLEPKPDPSRYYVLGDDTANAPVAPVDCEKTVLVGPVTLAGYLNNPKIARRLGDNEIEYLAWDFWAAPLSRALPGELIAALDRAMPDVCVFSYRKASATENSVQLELFIEQFEMTDSGNVVVVVSWSLLSNDGKTRRQSTARVTRTYEMGVDDVVLGVESLSVALGDLAKLIAEELR